MQPYTKSKDTSKNKSKRPSGAIQPPRLIAQLLLLFLLLSIFPLSSCQITAENDPLARLTSSQSKDLGIEAAVQAIENRQPDLLYNLMSDYSKTKYSESDVVNRQKKIYEDLGVTQVKLSNFEFLKMVSSDTERTYDATMTITTAYGEIVQGNSFSFTYDKSQKRWEINWTPAVIMPGLTADNRIIIESTTGKRGTLYDRNGQLLAGEAKGVTIGAIAGKFTEAQYAEASALLGVSQEALAAAMKQTWIKEGHFVPLVTDTGYTQEILSQLATLSLAYQNVNMRSYPLDKAAAHIVGYIDTLSAEEKQLERYKNYPDGAMVGKTGLEALFENRLRGKSGIRIYITGDTERTLHSEKALDGENIYTTLDANVQKAIYDQIAEDNGVGVAVDPKSGGLLALVSTPSYSPYGFMLGMSNTEYQALANSPLHPFLNKYEIAYSPGSTMKVLTSIVGLDSGTITPSSSYEIIGDSWQKDSSWGAYHVTRLIPLDGPVALDQALTRSDNIYFARTASDTGAAAFIDGLHKLGIGEEVPGIFPLYTSQISNSGQLNNSILLADTGYGQGEILISAPQMAVIYSALINGGNIMVPQIELAQAPEVWKAQISSPENLTFIQSSLRNVVTKSYPQFLDKPYAKLAGKSGTSESGKMVQGEQAAERGWFIGYDQDNPNLMLAITLADTEVKEFKYTLEVFGRCFDTLYAAGPYQLTQTTVPKPESQPTSTVATTETGSP